MSDDCWSVVCVFTEGGVDSYELWIMNDEFL